MAFLFSGFFALAGQDVLEAALKHWPLCKGRLIDSPFKGIGVSCPSFLKETEREREELFRDLIYEVKNTLPEWSRNFPDCLFVYLMADCFGGVCYYEGYVCQNSEKIVEKSQELVELLTYLGVVQETTYFEPFTRGYFD